MFGQTLVVNISSLVLSILFVPCLDIISSVVHLNHVKINHSHPENVFSVHVFSSLIMYKRDFIHLYFMYYPDNALMHKSLTKTDVLLNFLVLFCLLILDLSPMKAKFAEMHQKHAEQEMQTNDFMDESNALLEAYANAVSLNFSFTFLFFSKLLASHTVNPGLV